MFFKLIFYLFVLKSAFGFRLRYPGTGDPWVQNDYEYNHRLSGWLKLHAEPAKWLTARVNCHMEGAFLASPWSDDFTDAIQALIKYNLLVSRRVTSEMMWSGVHSSFDEGALISVDGQQVVSLRNDDLVPLERCGVFRAYMMDQAPCDTAFPYICYRPGLSAPPSTLEIPDSSLETSSDDPSESSETSSHDPITDILQTEQTTAPTDMISKTLKKLITSSTELPLREPAPSTETVLIVDSSKCGDDSLGYQFAELTGHCYKFHAHAVNTWDLAKSACEEEGAHLAIVNSDEEVKVLRKIYAKKIYGAPFPDTAAIGFYYDGRIWKTLEGESIEEAGYAKWRPEAPHFTARLGFIARDGLLYGYANDIRHVPYICEKPALKQEIIQATERTETKTISTELEEGFVPKWYRKLVDEDDSIEPTTVTIADDETIESAWNTESVSLADETNKAIKSTLNTESETVANDTNKAIVSTLNTMSEPVAEKTNEAIESTLNTESETVADDTNEAIESTLNTESKTVADDTNEAIGSIWNTEAVPVAVNPDSVPAAEKTDEAIKSRWNTESDERKIEDYYTYYDNPSDWYYNIVRSRELGRRIHKP